MAELKWLGHAGFEILGAKKVFIDPFKAETTDKADVIFITHGHYDHLSKEDIARLSTKDTVIVITPDGQSSLSDFPGKVLLVEPNKDYDADGIKFHTVPSYNTNKQFHPKQNEWVGYVIEADGKRIYHAGDTDVIPEMEGFKKLNIDVALLPVSGTYVMTASEAAKAAEMIMPKLAIPMHWGTIVGTQKDAEMFRDLLNGKVQVQVPPK